MDSDCESNNRGRPPLSEPPQHTQLASPISSTPPAAAAAAAAANNNPLYNVYECAKNESSIRRRNDERNSNSRTTAAENSSSCSITRQMQQQQQQQQQQHEEDAMMKSSDRDSLGGNNSGNSQNVVTATTNTSSGDDHDSSGGNASGSGSRGLTNSELSGSGDAASFGSGRHSHSHTHHNYPHRNGRLLPPHLIHTALDNGLPGDDGSDRLASISMVTASRGLPPPNIETTNRTTSRPTRNKTKSMTRRMSLTARCRAPSSPESVDSNPDPGGGGGSSSGSGTEGGYAGSASSDEHAGQRESCSSPSVCSSEESLLPTKSKRHRGGEDNDKLLHRNKAGKKKQPPPPTAGNTSSSSEMPDFSSSGASENEVKIFAASASASPSLSSSSNGSSGGLEESYLSAQKQAVVDQQAMIAAATRKRKAGPSSGVPSQSSWRHRIPLEIPASSFSRASKQGRVGATVTWSQRAQLKDDTSTQQRQKKHPPPILEGKPPIMILGSDMMCHVLTFLEPPEILDVLTMPLSMDWRQSFTSQAELWRVLCLVEPFKARILDDDEDDDDDASSGEDSFCSLGGAQKDHSMKWLLGRYRLLYTSFVRCMRYLSQIKDDAVNGRSPSFIDYGLAGGGVQQNVIGTNKNLKHFLARARGVVSNAKRLGSSSSGGDGESAESNYASEMEERSDAILAVSIDDRWSTTDSSGRSRRKVIFIFFFCTIRFVFVYNIIIKLT
jgi:hypothetical protein